MSNFRAPDHPCKETTVLLVGDDRLFRTTLAVNLRDDGHTVLECGNHHELPALPTLDGVTVVLTDCEPHTVAVARALHAAHPATAILLVAAEPTPQCCTVESYMRLLCKPIDYEELHRVLHGSAPA